MKGFFDTNILIDFLLGDRRAKEEFNHYEERHISVITSMEVLVGAKNGREEMELKAFLKGFTSHSLTTDIAERAVQIRRVGRLRLPDAIIKSTAELLGLTLITRNTKDFSKKTPGIRVPY